MNVTTHEVKEARVMVAVSDAVLHDPDVLQAVKSDAETKLAVTPIPRADVEADAEAERGLTLGMTPEQLLTFHREAWARHKERGVFVFDGPVEPWRLAALVPDPLRRRTLLDRLCWWRR